jgi:hypothetical protein
MSGHSDACYSNVRYPVVDGSKVCAVCERIRHADEFYVAYRRTDGRIQLQNKCKRCVLAEKKLVYLNRAAKRSTRLRWGVT